MNEASPSDKWVEDEARGDEVLERFIRRREELYLKAASQDNRTGMQHAGEPAAMSEMNILKDAIAARNVQLDREAHGPPLPMPPEE